MRDRYSMAVVTNDIYTQEDALILNARAGDLPRTASSASRPAAARIPPSARTPRSTSPAIADLNRKFPDLDIVLIESGGDNLAATFSPDLADITLYVISVCQGEEIPRKGGPAITRSDLLVINKTDLAPYVGANLDVMERDAHAHARQASPSSSPTCSAARALPGG